MGKSQVPLLREEDAIMSKAVSSTTLHEPFGPKATSLEPSRWSVFNYSTIDARNFREDSMEMEDDSALLFNAFDFLGALRFPLNAESDVDNTPTTIPQLSHDHHILSMLHALQFPLNAESDDDITPTTIPKLSHTLSMLHIFTEDSLIHVAQLEDDAPPVVADDILSMLHNFI
ncbi:hypothetical protein Godav_006761 [Gossypium davidsonii]|uniref:Uncharacterized protein n=2 Tax=Gossypium TaxID=3633 RepID=A0A7J8S4U2_GOSDV|nr:hypothetical protein [Gossypium davidsonii]MBA0656564.1 hypothetical protein [Gossypium klotzschianum]